MNYWNTYQKFHAANKDQEITRLGDIDICNSSDVWYVSTLRNV